MENGTKSTPEPIAIIGSSCRLPGGTDSPNKLWELLKQPVDLLTEIPQSRFNPAGFYHENAEHPGTTNVTKAYFLEDEPWAFDNDFFNISAREAESMDPQQRIVLETVYESIESAGYTISQLKGSSTGVFVGQMSDDYNGLVLRDAECHPQYTATGTARSILANRISYFFDWKGPSMNIDTACSSSLVALHLAVQSLRCGESEIAIVAGANLMLSPEFFSFLSSLRMLSSTGRSRMWDASADGYARGEGFAVVAIKTLEKALSDGDDVESVIRNTGVNQDGRSAGLTVPNATSQADLMKSTYSSCGLDCRKEEDRCQYFEAHGTGTAAGDPKEAEGISTTFFPNHDSQYLERREGSVARKIHVGSIKTVIGHLEGTAGIASLLKTSQTVQHGLIPPNLHFSRLNPAIEPYYHNLEVATQLQPWPELPEGAPRRASVNSFGFGGTNSHAIIESLEDRFRDKRPHSSSPCWGPFVLSANSEKSLTATIKALSTALKNQSDIDLSRLAWTLQSRRTHFTYRASFSANSKEELITKLNATVAEKGQSPIATRASKSSNIRILGVFTGQGAQWASMGAGLYQHSATFRHTIDKLESTLMGTPDSPTWSLSQELLAQSDPLRTSSAEISQPLCTALQVALVDLLRECGITFSAVVGHSSGEIAAAYAAGILKAEDAILIAFYRGYHSRRAQHENPKPGKMMAAGMTPENAEAFCRQPPFLGRISVAAKNSPSSVTISGDAKSIDDAKFVLDEMSVFARILKVDTAYHSHHMERVREPYLASLTNTNIKPLRNCFRGACNWYSSVHGPDDNKSMNAPVSFEDMYWVENMTNPVLFSQAVASAMQKEQFDLALEIGPHPALRAPASETIKEVSGSSIRYQGVLERNKDALVTFSNALGFVWKSFDLPVPPVDFAGFQIACNGPNWNMPRVQKGLPPYSWDHDRPMLKESKRSKAYRTRKTPFHELLGHPNSSGGTREIRWRNILRLSDMNWLRGHQFQNQVLLPAAGYVAMAVNAAIHLVGDDQSIQLIDLEDVIIHNGVALEESSPGVELNFVIRLVGENSAGKTAEFSCRCSNADAASTDFDKEVFTGRVYVKLGLPIEDSLPSRMAPRLPLTDVTTDRFYSWMQKVGLNYSEPFILDSIKRRLNFATVTTMRMVSDRYVIHPATLDSILHGLYVAFSYPGDGRMWTTYLPKSFGRIRFDINARQPTSSHLVADCYVTEPSARMICGDIDVFCADDGHAEIQIQGAVFSSLEVPNVTNDRKMFWRTVWKSDILSAIEPAEGISVQSVLAKDEKLHEICERTAYFYLGQLCKEVSQQEIASMEWHFQSMMRWANEYVRAAAQSGQHPRWNASWDTDTIETIKSLRGQQYADQVDLKLIHSLGSQFPSILRGEPALQVLKEDGMLERLYIEGLGFREANDHLGPLLDHLTHRYPRMRVLEIGAGTGGSTNVALRHLEHKLEDYTFTDVSPGFFPAAKARFAKYESIINYQVLDIERSPLKHGFQAHSYDLIIAAHVLHATRTISETVKHCRELLRPGGYLILLELTSPTTLRIPFLFSALPGWWLGQEDGRTDGPMLTEAQWDAVLKDNQFSGVDRTFRDFDDNQLHTFSIMVSQAVDDRVSILRDPLYLANGMKRIEKLLIIGGHSLTVCKMAAKVQSLFSPFAEHIQVINRLEDAPASGLKYGGAVMCLSGLEEATFARVDQQRVSAIQSLFREAKYILWATKGCLIDDPYANMIVGIGRSATREMAHLRLKFVDVDQVHLNKHQLNAIMFSEMLVEMINLDQPTYDDILWSNETEVIVENGAVLIPRVVPDDDLNSSINSDRRKITRNVPLTSTPSKLIAEDDSISIEVTKSGDNQTVTNSLQVLTSSLFQFACSDRDQSFYICLGSYSADPKHNVVAISETSGSTIMVPADYTIDYKGSASTDEILTAILFVMMCESLVSGSTGTIWIHDADDYIVEIISTVVGRQNIPVFLTTSDIASGLVHSGKATFIHPRAAERELRSLIPRNIGRFVNLGVEADSLAEFAASHLGQKVDVQQGIHQINVNQRISLSYSKNELMIILESYCSQPDFLHKMGRLVKKNVVKADLVHEQLELAAATSIISWTDIQSVQVRVTQASNTRLFEGQKTYFLVGLTGDLGLSICEWMADHGARYLAIASRKPAVPAEMCKHFERRGVALRIFSLDVANMENLKTVYQEIISSMPPIGGVANAALVVRDCPFDSMSFEDFEAVFKPKVIGSLNLDKLFSSNPLDFFILFSSVTSITGRPGQTNYNAANLFMSTLAAQRRKRGLAASVMHFGMLLGLGFVHGQAGPSIETRVRQDDFNAIPEPDFHEIFAQAIISGRPDSGLDPQIIAGLGIEIDTPWRALARFGHCRIRGDERHTEGKRHDQDHPSQNIQDQLKGASDSKQAFSVLNQAIATRLKLALGSSDGNVNETVGLVSLGLDSLVAVEIRSWLLATLEVDVPALKFLSGSSLHDICHDVLSKLSDSLTPWSKNENYDENEANGELNDVPNGTIPSLSVKAREVISRSNGMHNTVAPPHLEESNGKLSEEATHNPDVPPPDPTTSTISDAQIEKPAHPAQPAYQRVGDMSHAQAQLFFLHQYLQSNAYNIAYFGRFLGKIDMTRLQEALWVVGKRHEALRSAYIMDMSNARPVQAVLPEPRIVLVHRNTSDHSQVQSEIESVKDFRFDIEHGFVMKVTVISHSPSFHSILFSHHHIALDGVGWSVFIADLAQAYSGRLKSTPAKSGIQQCIDMAKKQVKALAHQDFHDDLAFWKTTYRTVPEPLPLLSFAKVKTRPTVKNYRIDSCDMKLPSNLTRLIDRTAATLGTTSFHFYIATLATFLGRCLGVSDLAIGVVDANRTDAEDMGTVGHFLNMLPVRIGLEDSESFEAVAKRSRDAALAAMAHSHAPLEMVLDGLGISRSTDHHPLFQVAINYRKSSLNESDFGRDGKIQWDGGVPGGHPYDMLFNIATMSDWTYISLITQHSLYEASDGALLLKWYTRALEALARSPSCEVSKCPISNEIDIAEAIELGRGSDLEVLWKGSLTNRIDEVAAKLPDGVAIKDDQGHELTYARMTLRMVEIMLQLQVVQPPLEPNAHVAMLLDPVADAVCCILAILRMGLVWVPLDTRNHPQRLRAVVDESRPQVLICHSATKELAQQISADLNFTTILSIDDFYGNGNDNGCDEHKNKIPIPMKMVKDKLNKSNQPAMILYTSGSTGIPKGVVLTHGGLVNQIYGTTITLGLGREITLQQSPLGFDLMLDQIFLALCNGGTVIMVGKAGRGDPTHMADLMVRHSVTLTHFVPSEYLALLNYGHHILKKGNSWHYAMSGGEKMGRELHKAFRKLNSNTLELVNVYGPAEITVACARGIVPYRELNDVHDDSGSDHLRPSPNYAFEIIDPDMNVLPIGFPGEICILGQGVGLGYLERPEESRRKFTHRKSAASSTRPIRIYRSGDKGRILSDGTLQVLGRLDGDSQVKINGFRIELDEIANAIVHISNGTIVNAAASLRPNQLSDTLVAFVVFDIEFAGDKANFIEWLRSNLPLPPIMKPTFIVPTQQIPATANGKTDRAAVDKLPIPESDFLADGGTLTYSLSTWERSMKRTWEEVLSARSFQIPGSKHNRSVIQPSSDFFQVGGSSILMIKLKALLEVQFGVKVSMPELFHASTLSSMATLVANATEASQDSALISTTTGAFLGPKDTQPVVNWDLEIASIADGLPKPTATSSPSVANLANKNGGLIVILTGATGFIGRHLLSHLIQNPKVAQVHCLAMRPDEFGNPRHVSIKSDKVIEYVGDLSTLNLGLSDDQFTFLTEHAHVIIHNGADVSLLKTYRSLRRANVVATRTLCEMAIPRRLPLHYISTASVAKVMQLNDNEPLLEVSASPAVPELLNSVDGYAATKWASEMLLEKAATDNELPAYIHRLAHVVGNDASELDVVGMLTKYSLLLRTLPRIELGDITGQWDFVMVPDVARDTVESVISSATGDGDLRKLEQKIQQSQRTVFVNHCSHDKIPHERLRNHLEEMAREPLREVTMREWLAAASDKGLHPLVYEFFAAFDEGQGKLVLPIIAKGT